MSSSLTSCNSFPRLDKYSPQFPDQLTNLPHEREYKDCIRGEEPLQSRMLLVDTQLPLQVLVMSIKGR